MELKKLRYTQNFIRKYHHNIEEDYVLELELIDSFTVGKKIIDKSSNKQKIWKFSKRIKE